MACDGLAHQMVYGEGEGQNTKHFYAGAPRTPGKYSNKPKKGRKKKKNTNKTTIVIKKG